METSTHSVYSVMVIRGVNSIELKEAEPKTRDSKKRAFINLNKLNRTPYNMRNTFYVVLLQKLQLSVQHKKELGKQNIKLIRKERYRNPK